MKTGTSCLCMARDTLSLSEEITGFLIVPGYKLTVTQTSTGQSNKQLPLGAVLSRMQ